MTTVLDTIPEHLQNDADAAVAWFNSQEGAEYHVTGVVDPPESAGQELRLILCGSGTCRQETFQVNANTGVPQIKWLGADNVMQGGVAELDPPPGPRKKWIDEVCGRHAFVVLLFYRGFW